MSCMKCRKPQWSVLTPHLSSAGQDKLALSMDKETLKGLAWGECFCEEKSQLTCQRHDDASQPEDTFFIKLMPETFSTQVPPPGKSLQIMQISSGNYGTVYKVKRRTETVLKILKDFRSESTEKLIEQAQKTKNQLTIGYFLLESVFNTVMGDCEITPVCYGVGIYCIDGGFSFGIEMKSKSMDLRKYLCFPVLKQQKEKYKEYQENLIKITDAVWKHCHKLAECGFVWWDIKPANIVLDIDEKGWRSTRAFVTESLRFIDMDPKYLVRVEGKEAVKLTNLNFLLFINSLNFSPASTKYRNNIFADWKKKHKAVFNLMESIRELSILNKSILSSKLKEKYPAGHIEPYLLYAHYGKYQDFAKIGSLLGIKEDTMEVKERTLSQLDLDKWDNLFIYWGDFQNFLDNDAPKDQDKYENHYK